MAKNNTYETVLRSDGSKERMQITRLPLYGNIGEPVLKLTELPSFGCQAGSTIISSLPFRFDLPHIKFITNHRSSYELQLRIFCLNTNKEQSDDFPPNCILKINRKFVVLKRINSTLNTEGKYRPLNITSHIPSSDIGRTHHLEIKWLNDNRKWVVGIWLIHPLNASFILQTGMRQAANETKKRIIEMLNRDDRNIKMEKLKISLLCPISKIQVNVPVRSKTCSHLQCFDLSNFLNLNEKTSTWKCPICNVNANYDNLIIDQYFMDLLETVKHKNVKDVELLRNGDWKILEGDQSTATISGRQNNVDVITLDDSNDYSRGARESISSTRNLQRNNEPEIITLDSSDDESNATGAINTINGAPTAANPNVVSLRLRELLL